MMPATSVEPSVVATVDSAVVRTANLATGVVH